MGIHLSSYSFPGAIWKIWTDHGQSGTLIEVLLAKEQRKGLTFRANGDERKDLPLYFPETGLAVGVEAFYSGVALLHGYREPSLPLHSGVEALDCENWEVLWSRPEFIFWRMSLQGPLVREMGREEEYLLLDLRSGQVLKRFEGNNQPDLLLLLQAYAEAENLHLTFPKKLVEGGQDFATHSSRLSNLPHRELDFLEWGQAQIFSWNQALEGGGFCQQLLILQGEKVLHTETLLQHSEKMQMDSFFLFRNELIALREGNEIVWGRITD